jgi:RNA polymerase sigma-70 factor (ECF subfamily)
VGPESRAGAPEQVKYSDAELLKRVANAHRDALGQLYVRHAGAVRAAARRITRDPGEADDLVHDVFLEIWRSADDYEPERGSVRTWLLVRTRSRSLDRRRRTNRRSPDEALGSGELGSTSPSADQLTLRRAITRLPDALRQLLELGYYAGMSSGEMAAALEIPLGTVKSRVARALAALRLALSDEEQADRPSAASGLASRESAR